MTIALKVYNKYMHCILKHQERPTLHDECIHSYGRISAIIERAHSEESYILKNNAGSLVHKSKTRGLHSAVALFFMSSMSIITLYSMWACIYINLQSRFDSIPDTYCLSLFECIYCLRESSHVVFMLNCEVYLQAGFTKLMPDKCVFVKLENNIMSVPAMQSADYFIDHGFWFVWVLCQ